MVRVSRTPTAKATNSTATSNAQASQKIVAASDPTVSPEINSPLPGEMVRDTAEKRVITPSVSWPTLPGDSQTATGTTAT